MLEFTELCRDLFVATMPNIIFIELIMTTNSRSTDTRPVYKTICEEA